MSKTITKSQSNMLTILAAILEVVIILPLFGTISYSVLMALIIMLGFLMFPDVISSKPFKYMFLFVLVELVYATIGKGLPYRMVIYYSLQFFAAIFICSHLRYLSKKQINLLFFILLGLLLFTTVVTYYALLTNNMIIRYNAYGADDITDSSRSFGVYSYGLGEALAIILPALTAFALLSKHRLLQVVCFILVGAGLLTQFMAALATSALLSAFFCALVVLSHLVSKQRRKNVFVPAFIVVVLVALFIPYSQIGENWAVSVKMEDVTTSYSTGSSVGQVESRGELYLQSLRVCLHNPILGLGEPPAEFGQYSDNTVSMHTGILDYWGMYGLFAVLFLLSWKGTINQNFQLLNGKRKIYRWALFSLFFLLLLKGPVTINLNFVFSTLLLSIVILKDYNDSSETNNSNAGQKNSYLG